jgi:hypothetical protein
MEPHREESQKALEPGATPKPKRFRIVKLEERIAPSKGGNGTHNSCACPVPTLNQYTCPTYGDTCYCNYTGGISGCYPIC